MFNLSTIFHGKEKRTALTKEQIAELLKVSPEALEAFERSYQALLDETDENRQTHPIYWNAKEAVEKHEDLSESPEELERLKSRIVDELVARTVSISYEWSEQVYIPEIADQAVTKEEIEAFPKELRPYLSGTLYKIDADPRASATLFMNYKSWLEEKNPEKKKHFYGMFRSGLDLLDLDPLIYETLSLNPNSMGNWLPQLADAVKLQSFFKIPKTKVIRVPLPLLQLSRLEYSTLNRTTLDIVDDYCRKVFGLDINSDYFIKTGVFSSKFDFRNAHVTGANEVRELGEYLLFIQHQACMMAGPLSGGIYGANTTNEWVVREFIQDKENNPSIYKGLPLHTEYRIFVDFDTKEILGISPYWEPNMMKRRFGHAKDSDSPHNIHDYITYTSHEETLMRRYNENKDRVLSAMQVVVDDIRNMTGQWSVDVMQNGDDFYIIDMALAENSALKECVPAGKLKITEENWVPDLKLIPKSKD